MSRLRNVVLLAALVVAGGSLPAQESAQPETQTPPASAPPAAPAAPPAAASAPPAASPRTSTNEDIFIPTEELQPDEQATFPVDI